MSTHQPTETESGRESGPETGAEAPRKTAQLTGNKRYISDARLMRNSLGLPQFKPESFEYQNVAPSALPPHTWEGGRERPSGGTDALVIGPPGAGKSTLAGNFVQIGVDAGETVVWRGSTNRSEWLPFAEWARVCLPKSARGNASALWQPRDPTHSVRETALADVVREVVYYDDPVDLWANKLLHGAFNVVYPDPAMSGCTRVLANSERTYGFEFSPNDPPVHWWVAALLARVEGETPNHWSNLIFDEIGDLAPEHAQADEYDTYDKVQLLRDVYADFRKFGLSIYMFGHVEADIHHLLRHKVRWRVTMNGTANPTSASKVVGFETVPMRTDLTSRLPVGECLMWTEQNFELVSWNNVEADTDDTLVLDLGVDAAGDVVDEAADEAGGAA